MLTTKAVSRRCFMGTMAVGAAGAMVAPTRAWANLSPNERPVLATIGLRNQGWAITSKTFQFADFAAMVDVDSNVLGAKLQSAAERQSHKPEGFKDYRHVLDRQDIDAVMIATPDHWHTKIAVEAMLAGKDVYCEKPLTLTIAEGKLIEKVVADTGRIFQVGTMQRTEFDNRFITAVALIAAGRIGTVKKITCGIGGADASPKIPEAPVPEGLDWDLWLGPAPKVPYRALPEMRQGYGGGVPLWSNCHYAFRDWYEYSGGQLTDWGAHHVDIASWALGISDDGPSKVVPNSIELPVEYRDGYPVANDQSNVATKFNLSVAMPGGVEMIITDAGDNGILFEGTEGRFFVNRGKITGKPVEELQDNPLPEDAIEKVYGGPVSANHSANWIESMRSRKQPISDVWSHNRAMEILHVGNIATRLGREVAWDPAKREVIGDDLAKTFMSRESRPEYAINM